MEMIHERKSEAGVGPHQPQKLRNLQNNKGAKRTTRMMDARIKSIQLQNSIPTREGGGKARRTHEKNGISTHGRRQETDTKCGNLIAKRKIL